MFVNICLLALVIVPSIAFANELTSGNVTENNCTCVPFHQCADGDSFFGSGLLDARKLEDNPCTGQFDVCCNSTQIIPQNQTKRHHHPEKKSKFVHCGHKNSGFFSWSASLILRQSPKSYFVHKCGVSLISKKTVITAAHCLHANQQNTSGITWAVRIGNTIRTAAKIIIHPSFNADTLHNDIALIILKTAVPISRKIGTVCIPPKDFVVQPSTQCDTPAWVKNNHVKHDANKSFSFLSMLKLPLIGKEECTERLRTTRLGPLFQLHSSFMCAGGTMKENSCEGNGGSPLMCPVPGQPGRFHQVGVVSWGIGCGESEVPGVYVNLPLFRDWIDEQMVKNQLGITSYRY